MASLLGFSAGVVCAPLDSESVDFVAPDRSAAAAGPLRSNVVRPAMNRTAVRLIGPSLADGKSPAVPKRWIVHRAYQGNPSTPGTLERQENESDWPGTKKILDGDFCRNSVIFTA